MRYPCRIRRLAHASIRRFLSAQIQTRELFRGKADLNIAALVLNVKQFAPLCGKYMRLCAFSLSGVGGKKKEQTLAVSAGPIPRYVAFVPLSNCPVRRFAVPLEQLGLALGLLGRNIYWSWLTQGKRPSGRPRRRGRAAPPNESVSCGRTRGTVLGSMLSAYCTVRCRLTAQV